MDPNEALNKVKTLGSALRAPIILGVCVIGGTMIGARNDAPVQGLAGGIVLSALVNAIIDYREAVSQVAS